MPGVTGRDILRTPRVLPRRLREPGPRPWARRPQPLNVLLDQRKNLLLRPHPHPVRDVGPVVGDPQRPVRLLHDRHLAAEEGRLLGAVSSQFAGGLRLRRPGRYRSILSAVGHDRVCLSGRNVWVEDIFVPHPGVGQMRDVEMLAYSDCGGPRGEFAPFYFDRASEFPYWWRSGLVRPKAYAVPRWDCDCGPGSPRDTPAHIGHPCEQVASPGTPERRCPRRRRADVDRPPELMEGQPRHDVCCAVRAGGVRKRSCGEPCPPGG